MALDEIKNLDKKKHLNDGKMDRMVVLMYLSFQILA